jgi:hypothetical protein
MLVPRVGAVILLIGLGFAAAQIFQLAYVVAAEGFKSWLLLLAFLVPTGIVATVSAILVLRRDPRGIRLVVPLAALVAATAVVTFIGAPPVGGFLDDYEQAALARGVDVPEYRRGQGWTERDYVENRTSEVRSQGTIGAIAAVGLYVLLVRARQPRRPRAPSPAS